MFTHFLFGITFGFAISRIVFLDHTWDIGSRDYTKWFLGYALLGIASLISAIVLRH